MRIAVIYVASALAIWFTLGFINGIDRYEKLKSSGVPVTGTVIDTTCGNHGSFTYEYDVEGTKIRAVGKSSVGGLHCETLTLGTKVPVTYLVRSPTESVAGSPAAALREERTFIAVLSLFFPAFVIWLVRRKQKGNEL